MHRELFPRTTGEGFDPITPAAIAADVTIGFVLQPDRAARMVAQNAVDQALPGLGEVIDRLTKATFDAGDRTPYEAEVRRAIERVLVDRRDVAGQRVAQQPGARHRVAQAAEAGDAAARRSRQNRIGSGRSTR